MQIARRPLKADGRSVKLVDRRVGAIGRGNRHDRADSLLGRQQRHAHLSLVVPQRAQGVHSVATPARERLPNRIINVQPYISVRGRMLFGREMVDRRGFEGSHPSSSAAR